MATLSQRDPSALTEPVVRRNKEQNPQQTAVITHPTARAEGTIELVSLSDRPARHGTATR
jgi:hypothetical protein